MERPSWPGYLELPSYKPHHHEPVFQSFHAPQTLPAGPTWESPPRPGLPRSLSLPGLRFTSPVPDALKVSHWTDKMDTVIKYENQHSFLGHTVTPRRCLNAMSLQAPKATEDAAGECQLKPYQPRHGLCSTGNRNGPPLRKPYCKCAHTPKPGNGHEC